MPDYQFTDPSSGLTLSVSGPEPPPQGVLAQMFADAAKKAPNVAASVEKAHPEATIGPDTGGLLSPNHEPVTLGQLIADPSGALKRMVAITKQGLSDPRNTIPAAVGLAAGALGLGPASFASTRGAVAAPAAAPVAPPASRVGLVQAVKNNVRLDDLAEMTPSSIRAGYRVAKGVLQATRQATRQEPPPAQAGPVPAAPPRQPVEVAAAPTPIQDAPPASAPTPKPAAAAPSPKGARAARKDAPTPAKAATSSPIEDVGDLPSLDDLHLTPAEITTAVKWHDQGVSPETILHRVLQSRQLTARTRTETPDQAAAAVKQRNETGRWGDEGYVK